MGRPEDPYSFLAQHPSWMEVPMTRGGVNCVADAFGFRLTNLVNNQPAGIVDPNHRSAVCDRCIAVVCTLCPIEACVTPPGLQVRGGGSRPVEGARRDRLRLSLIHISEPTRLLSI